MSFTLISAATAKKMMRERSITVVDIRDPLAYIAGHISSAMSLNNDNVDLFMDEADVYQPLLVYCYHGHNSPSVGRYFASQGFDDVYSIEGGFDEWRMLDLVRVDVAEVS